MFEAGRILCVCVCVYGVLVVLLQNCVFLEELDQANKSASVPPSSSKSKNQVSKYL